jgi:hypothetical protein
VRHDWVSEAAAQSARPGLDDSHLTELADKLNEDIVLVRLR